MKRFLLLSLVLVLVISCAAPSGVVFALEEGDKAVVISEESGDEQIENLTTQDTEQLGMSDEPMTIHDESGRADSIPPPQPDIIQLLPPELPDSPLIITAYKATGAHLHAVQIYNNSSVMQPLDGYELLFVAGDEEYPIMLPVGWIKPRSYMALAWQDESVMADGEYVLPIGDEAVAAQDISLMRSDIKPNKVIIPANYDGSLMHRFKSSAGNYTTNTTFSAGADTVLSGGLYVLPDAPDISVLEVLVNPKSCVIGQETEECYDYIKIKNTGVAPVDLSLYRLRSGYSNASSSATNTTYLSGVIEENGWMIIAHDRDGKRVSFTANDGTVWLEDVYGYVSFDLGVPPYIGSDRAVQVGRSWAYSFEAGTWRWAIPSPLNEANDFTEMAGSKGSGSSPRELVPCRDDQYRSEETNRCRTIAVARTLIPCREGQYRSEETNRCRSIATAANALKPCADDQFRNPDTNRCKKIASSDDIALADCGEGRERNPLTNRCRNVKQSIPPAASFAVEPIRDSASVFIGWWVLSGVALAAVGYGGWEWREEIGRVTRKVFRPGKSMK